MHSKKNTNIFQIARQIQQQSEQAQKLAKNITNAYRNVEQLKVSKPTNIVNKDIAVKPKGQSSYANKIKETLKQLNANKAKQIELLKNVQPQKMHSLAQKPFNSQETKLKRAASMKLCKFIEAKQLKLVTEGFAFLKMINKDESFKENQFIRKWKLNRIFNAWRDEVILIKISKERTAKENQKREKQSLQIAIQFRKFSILKKCFKEWNHQIKKQRKRKMYELEIRKQELQQRMRKQQQIKKKPQKQPQISQNSQLQGKLRGFLDGLKDKIENKDRLKTIKQKTEESQMRIRQQQSQRQINASEQLREQSNREEQSEEAVAEAPVNQENMREAYDEKKPMNSQQLQKRRKELQSKYKNRKQNLEKLKKMKEEKKKEQQRQVQELEKQIQMEQKKIKQQQYRQFIKNKQLQQEWEKKEKVLMQKSQEFNQMRIIKYYGWHGLIKAKELKIVNCNQMSNALLKVVLRFNFSILTQQMKEISDHKLDVAYSKMESIHRRKLFKKCLLGFKSELIQQRQLKAELIIRHQVNTLKIVLKEWKQIIPTLTIQNFQWERPRNKKANIFRNFNLMQKGLQSLKQHKNEEQRERNIEEHKKKIKNRIQNMLQESSQVNYAQFL